MEQLSTGSKINSAKDDAAGLAMASKFTAQIKGLDMAVKNASDAISMISTAEGALDEVGTMLQRMRELAVQSSNGTVTAEDRDYMDLEYQALDDEINRIANNTQWNGENVLNGKAGGQGENGADSSEVSFQISANFSTTTASNAVKYAATDLMASGTLYSDGSTADNSASVVTGRAAATALDESDEFLNAATLADVATALGTGWSVKAGQGALDSTSNMTAAAGHNSGAILFEHAGQTADITVTIATATANTNANAATHHKATSSITSDQTARTAVVQNTALSGTSSVTAWETAIAAYNADANNTDITVPTAISGLTDKSVQLDSVTKTAAVTGGVTNDIIKVDFGDLASDMSNVRSSDLQDQDNSQAAMATLDTALKAVNLQRATFGSATNRLEHAVDNMTNIQNNAEASRSRIEDTDYAETTSELAKAQIIAQAGTAMLAQANQSSQSVLSLLR
jgi:flagellin